jgi:hypothetical protein
MKALISPTESASNIVNWELNPNWDGVNPRNKYLPIYEVIPNAERVCEVVEQEFLVAEPLFWMDCADDVLPDQFYFDTETNEVLPVVNAPMPE